MFVYETNQNSLIYYSKSNDNTCTKGLSLYIIPIQPTMPSVLIHIGYWIHMYNSSLADRICNTSNDILKNGVLVYNT